MGKALIHHPRMQLAFRLILGITFITASLHKVIDPGKFAQIIYGYGLFPENLINLMAIIVPFLELFCGILLVLGIYKGGASLIVNIMLAGFIIAISTNLIRGYEFDCGCFTNTAANDAFNSVDLLLRDILLLGMGIMVFFSDRPPKPGQ